MKATSKSSMFLLAAMIILAMSLPSAASVTYVQYQMDTPNGTLGATQSYGGGIYQINASGWKTNNAPVINGTLGGASGTWHVTSAVTSKLYGKTGEGAAEDGLGMAEDPDGDNEQWDQPANNHGYQWGFTVLDVRNIEAIANLLYFQVQIGSAQDHEWFTIWGSNDATPGTATLLLEGKAGSSAQTPFFDIPNWRSYSYIWFGAIIDPNSTVDHSDTVINSQLAFSQTAVPEPSTLGMMGSGLISLAFSLRKRFLNQ